MARPKHLSTKGEFNVIQVYDDYWQLRFMNRVVICGSNSRSYLYRLRKKYNFWFSVISRLQQCLKED